MYQSEGALHQAYMLINQGGAVVLCCLHIFGYTFAQVISADNFANLLPLVLSLSRFLRSGIVFALLFAGYLTCTQSRTRDARYVV